MADISKLRVASIVPVVDGNLLPKTWNGLTSFSGTNIWTDGENIYYSSGSSQYVLDKATSTWLRKTWIGLTSFNGNNVWTDGDNIYYSTRGDGNYVLDKATSTWSQKTWTGLTSFNGTLVWTDGDNIYYSRSDSSENYVLDKLTATWTQKTWTGRSSLDGNDIWTDGENIYYSGGYSSSQYVLDKATSTWSAKTWTGLSRFEGKYVWTDGKNLFLSSNIDDNKQYVLDKATSTWSQTTWTGRSSLDGNDIWTDGDNIYYSYSNNQYVFELSGVEEYNTYDIKDSGAREGLDNRGLVFKSERLTGLPTPESRPELNGQVAMYNGDSQITIGGVDFIPGHFYLIETALGASTYTFTPTGTMNIPLASTTAPGLMQVGSGLSVDANGVVSADGGGGGGGSSVLPIRSGSYLQVVNTLPTPSSMYDDKPYFFVGAASGTTPTKQAYRCVSDDGGNTYQWRLEMINIRDTSSIQEVSSLPDPTSTELWNVKYNNKYYRRVMNYSTSTWEWVECIIEYYYLPDVENHITFNNYPAYNAAANPLYPNGISISYLSSTMAKISFKRQLTDNGTTKLLTNINSYLSANPGTYQRAVGYVLCYKGSKIYPLNIYNSDTEYIRLYTGGSTSDTDGLYVAVDEAGFYGDYDKGQIWIYVDLYIGM